MPIQSQSGLVAAQIKFIDRRLCAKKYKGNWNRYADIWNRRLANLQRKQINGNTAVLNNGISLKDAELVNYIEKIEQRVGVIYCLGKEASAVQASGK